MTDAQTSNPQPLPNNNNNAPNITPAVSNPTPPKKEDKPEIIETEKFKAWLQLYLDPSKKETYLNATQCALKTYDTTDYWTAGNIGSKNLKKAKTFLAEKKGMTFDKLLDIGYNKMITTGEAPSWIELMEFLGYKEKDDPKSQAAIIPVQINNFVNTDRDGFV